MRAFVASAFLLSFASFPLFAQIEKAQSLAPYRPSPQVIVDRMLEASRLRPSETVYDLGSGDGRVVITAARRFRARAVGVELSKDLCRKSTEKIRELGLADRVKIINANLLDVDLSPADVVTIYLLTSSNDLLKPNLERYLKPGARVVSNDFEIRGWKAREVVRVSTGGTSHSIYVYEMGHNR